MGPDGHKISVYKIVEAMSASIMEHDSTDDPMVRTRALRELQELGSTLVGLLGRASWSKALAVLPYCWWA